MYRLLVVVLLLPFLGFSQFTVSGKIFNPQNIALKYAEVTLFTLESNAYQSGITDENGLFQITNIPKGNYQLVVNYFSEKVYSENITVESDLELDDIIVTEAVVLDEIIVESSKRLIEKKVDRIVFNVENSTAAAGGNAFDALRLVPRVKIVDDKIMMVGKGSLLVMIDDRLQKFSPEDLANYLKTLSADDLKSIEVISNPPAKYSAEGNSGLLNIITKKAKKDAWNGSVKGTYLQSTYDKEYFSATYNLQKGKFQLNSMLNFVNGSSAAFESNQIDYPNLLWREESNRRDFTNGNSGKLGIEYQVSDKISTGVTINFSNRDMTLKEIDKTDLYNISTTYLDSIILTNARNIYDIGMKSLNYHLIYKIDTIGRKLSLDVDYFNFNDKSSRNFDSESLFADFHPTNEKKDIGRSSGVQDVNNISLNIDMEHPLKWINLNYGAKLSFVETTNDSEFYDIINAVEIFNTTISNEFNYQENTQALYLSGTKKISKKWDSKIGLRYEISEAIGFSKTANQTNKKSYAKLFPTVYISYNPNETNSFSIDYSRRIGRPSFQSLNPFRIVSNPYSYTEGNPFLQPSFSQNLEIGYSFKDRFISNLSFYQKSDGYMQVTLSDPITNIQQIIPLNILETVIINFSNTYSLKPTKWLDLSSTLNLYYTNSHSTLPDILEDLSGVEAYGSILSDITLSKDKTWKAGIFYSFQSKGIDELDRSSSANILNLSMKYLLLDKKLAITLSGNDVLSSNRYSFTSYSGGLKNVYRNYYDDRYLTFSILYSFGKSFKISERGNKNQDEQNRAN